LADFDEVWNSLSSKEQAKIIHLLVERVGFDGRDQSVTVTFRSEGLKQLCQRTAA
jgi:site-specific DNA recombinase